jgi:ABC-type multidrug transport system ATPase subunit
LTDALPALAVRELEVVYQRGGEPAARDVTFTLDPGHGLLLTGDHGSGKTSVLRAILGLAVATGEITVFGATPGIPEVMARVGYGPQGKTFIERHTGREIVNLVATLRTGRSAAGVAADALDRAGIPSHRRDTRSLDVEEVRRVALACAIAADPELIVLDDPWEFPETIVQIERARARGAAVLVATDEPGGFAALLGRTITLVDGLPA